jgi:hypothetical protein
MPHSPRNSRSTRSSTPISVRRVAARAAASTRSP